MRPWLSPNAITAARMPLAPLAVVAMTWGTTAGLVAAAVLSLVLELTDLADGIVARRYRMVSPFGSLFDPFSDAFCRYTLFLGLFSIGVADLWMIVLIFWRDSSVSFFRSIAGVRRVVLAARGSGKVKAVVQGVGTQVVFVALVASAFLPAWTWLASIPWWTMCFITAVTMWSWVDYFLGNLPILRAAWDDTPS
jgi:CDP-diacylglycerol--glycerol-3-phosphate 3-phosphatidyltransferase